MTNHKPPLTPGYLAERHRKQVRLQIWLPIGFAVLLALAVAVVAVLGTVYRSSEVNRWGNVSAVFLIMPNLVTSLASMTMLFLSVKGLSILYKKLPGWIHRLLDLLLKVQGIVQNLADKIATPIYSINRTAAGISAARKKLFHQKQSRSS